MPNSETDERSLILVCNCFKINPKTQPVLPIVGFIKNRKRAGVWDRKLVYIEPSQKSRRERRGQEKLKETDPIWIFRGFCQLEPRVSWLVLSYIGVVSIKLLSICFVYWVACWKENKAFGFEKVFEQYHNPRGLNPRRKFE